jgi:phosphatidate cytidylyltransferase
VTTRIITGAVLAVLAVVVVAHGGLVYFFLMLALGLLGLNEFYKLTKMYHPLPLAGFVSLAVMLYMAWFRSPVGVFGAIALSVLLVGLMGIMAGPRPGITVRMAVTLLGVLYLGLGISALLLLRRLDVGTAVVLTVVFGTWAGDTMAYFTGRFFGSTPMAPKLSPKKTWEGFAGGAISTVLLVVFIGLYTPLGPVDSLALGAVIAVVGPLGDLFESLVKRDVQIKDSGRGIPGHGGVLDRFDALLWTSVAAYFLLVFGLGF